MTRFFRDPCVVQRFANRLYRHGVPAIPRLLDYWIRFYFACWFPHTVQVGEGCSLGYGGLGCVIHSATVLGSGVHVGSNVLIGGNARQIGVPKVEDDVYIGSGAALIGPITIGKGAVIAANSVIIRDVKPYTVVGGNPSRVLKESIPPGYLHPEG